MRAGRSRCSRRGPSQDEHSGGVTQMTQLGHGRKLRGLDGVARSSIEAGRFGRMFRTLHPAQHRATALHELAETMLGGEPEDKPITEAEPEDENPTISAG